MLKDETIASLPEEYREYDKALDKAMQTMADDPAFKQMGIPSMAGAANGMSG